MMARVNGKELNAEERDLLAVKHDRCDDCGAQDGTVTCEDVGPPINECIHECAVCRAKAAERRRLDLEEARLERAAVARAEWTRCA